MNNDMTDPPQLPAPPIELDAFHLKKQWVGLLHDIINTLADTHQFLVMNGRTAAIAAVGTAWALKMQSAYNDLKPIAIEYSKLTDIPNFPTE